MKLGFSIGPAGASMEIPIARVLRAETLGYDCVWTAETYSSDAMTPLAFIGARTSKIKLGTSIAQLAARTATNTAMCAQTIDAMTGGNRMIVGLGVSGPQVVEGWYGRPWGKPRAHLRDYVEVMKKVLRREGPVTHQGAEISIPYIGPGSIGLGKPLKSILHGNPDIPILLGTSTPANIRLAGEIADGWISLHLTPQSYRDKFLPLIEQGLARRSDGRTREDFLVRGSLEIDVTGDVRQAIDSIKPRVALYVGGMGAKGKNYHKDAMVDCGFGAAAERIQELYLAGRKDEAIAAVPDEYVDGQALLGPPDRIRERWQPWADSGLDMIALLGANDEAIEVMARVAL